MAFTGWISVKQLSVYEVQQFVDPDVARAPATAAVLAEIGKTVPREPSTMRLFRRSDILASPTAAMQALSMRSARPCR